MAAVAWPTTLPAPLHEHSQEFTNGLANVDEVLWPQRVRRIPDMNDDIQFIFTQEQMEEFRDYFYTDLNAGCAWITADWITLLFDGADYIRFTEPYSSQLMGDGIWSVSGTVELLRI